MPFIHVARAQSSNTLGPQASCTPPDRGRVSNNADMHSIYIYEVWDAWDAWDAWDVWDNMHSIYMCGLGCNTKASYCVYALGVQLI